MGVSRTFIPYDYLVAEGERNKQKAPHGAQKPNKKKKKSEENTCVVVQVVYWVDDHCLHAQNKRLGLHGEKLDVDRTGGRETEARGPSSRDGAPLVSLLVWRLI